MKFHTTFSKRGRFVTFLCPEFGELEATVIDGTITFDLQDVLTLCNIKTAPRVKKSELDPEDCFSVPVPKEEKVGKRGGATKKLVVTEYGFWDIVFGSKVEGARAIKRWVSHDVLPTLRKTRVYADTRLKGKAAEKLQEDLQTALRENEALAEENARLAAENAGLTAGNEFLSSELDADSAHILELSDELRIRKMYDSSEDGNEDAPKQKETVSDAMADYLWYNPDYAISACRTVAQ